MIDQLSEKLVWQRADTNNFPTLEDSDLHLWCLRLELTAAQRNDAIEWISDIQRDRYARRATEQLQHSYLAGRYYLLQLLGLYTKQEPSDVLLSYSRLNKPFLSLQEHSIEFNFTDTAFDNKAFGLFAFSKNRAVGVDVEALSRRSDFDKIAQRRFTAQELDLVGSPVDPHRFLALWTRKEAYGKAIGKGINFTMNQRNLVDGLSAKFDFIDDQKKAWQLRQIELNDELISAVVAAGDQRLSIKAFNSLNQEP